MAPIANTPGVDFVGKVFQIKPHVGVQHQLKVSQTVLESLVSDNYFNALEEHKLQPIAMPKIDVDQNPSEEAGGFSFTAEFEVKPEIEIKDLSGLKVTKEKAATTILI